MGPCNKGSSKKTFRAVMPWQKKGMIFDIPSRAPNTRTRVRSPKAALLQNRPTLFPLDLRPLPATHAQSSAIVHPFGTSTISSSPRSPVLPAGHPDRNVVYFPWVPHAAHKRLTPGPPVGTPPLSFGQSPKKFVYVYVPFPFLDLWLLGPFVRGIFVTQ